MGCLKSRTLPFALDAFVSCSHPKWNPILEGFLNILPHLEVHLLIQHPRWGRWGNGLIGQGRRPGKSESSMLRAQVPQGPQRGDQSSERELRWGLSNEVGGRGGTWPAVGGRTGAWSLTNFAFTYHVLPLLCSV